MPNFSDYDLWKLQSPYDDYEEGPECDHDDYESDILTGDAYCYRCNYRWIMSADEVAAEVERIRRYDEWQREQERPWNRFKEWVARKADRLSDRWRRLWYPKTVPDDDIPF